MNKQVFRILEIYIYIYTQVPLEIKKECRQVVNCSAIMQIIDVLTSGETAAMTLEELMHYRITSLSLSLFTADGVFHKPMFMTAEHGECLAS